jgi:hypothetical protein
MQSQPQEVSQMHLIWRVEKGGVGSIWSLFWIIVALLGLFALGNMFVSCAQEMF